MNEWAKIWLDNCDETRLPELSFASPVGFSISSWTTNMKSDNQILAKINWDKLCRISCFSIPDNSLPDGSQSTSLLFSKTF